MEGKIGLEEHFAINETLMDSAGFVPDDHWPELRSRILDIHDRRLRLMDQHGMEMMLLSLNAPAVQTKLHGVRMTFLQSRCSSARIVSRHSPRFRCKILTWQAKNSSAACRSCGSKARSSTASHKSTM